MIGTVAIGVQVFNPIALSTPFTVSPPFTAAALFYVRPFKLRQGRKLLPFRLILIST
jgi:hypothetical protein